MSRRICLYSPADLNLVSGSSIWVQAVAATLADDPDAEIVVPLRSPERRGLITDDLRRLPRVQLVDPRRQVPNVPPSGLYASQALDLIEALDRERRFDAIVLRSFPYCLAAIDRPALRGRLWSTYVLEPERDLDDPAYLRDLGRIADASRWVVVQSEGMRALLEAAVPAARGRTIILPPAVPESGSTAAAGPPPARRLFYAGKFHPFYPVPAMIDLLEAIRPSYPGLEFHVIGDQIARPPGGEGWADDLERRLSTTDGVVWHGAVARDEVNRLLSSGGIALSLWDYRYGSAMNDLVVSTKLLDYCLAGVPVVLNRTAAQVDILGADYPLFVRRVDEAEPLVRRLLDDPTLYRTAAERCRAAAVPFAYPRVRATLAPFLWDRSDAASYLADRPKLPGAENRIGLPLPAGVTVVPAAALDAFRTVSAATPDAHLVVGLRAPDDGAPSKPGRDPAAVLRSSLPKDIADAVSLRTVDDPWNWWRTLGVVLAPSGVEVDTSSVDIALASGALPARDATDLVAAIATLAARAAPVAVPATATPSTGRPDPVL